MTFILQKLAILNVIKIKRYSSKTSIKVLKEKSVGNTS